MGDLAIRSATIHPYKLGLVPSARSKYGVYRVGRLIRLESETDLVGWGDAAPLPGFSRESIADVDRAWPALADALTTGSFELDRLVSVAPRSLAFAMEQAHLSIAGQASDQLPAAMLDVDHRPRVQVAGLVDEKPADAMFACRGLIRNGCRSLKIKTGSWNRPDAIRFLADLTSILPPDIRIHLDANRRWTLDDATAILSSVEPSTVEYVEEPLTDPSELPRLAESVATPIALDESLLMLDPKDLTRFAFAKFVILKPSLLGGIRRCKAFANAARSGGMLPVVSSSLESGLGLLWLVALAASRDFGQVAGIDTGRYLEQDVLSPPLELGYDVDVAITERLFEKAQPDA